MLGWEASQEHKDHAFHYVEVMWREFCMNHMVQEFHGKSSGISRITNTVSTGWNIASSCNGSCEMI